jgi:hypothetical protein
MLAAADASLSPAIKPPWPPLAGLAFLRTVAISASGHRERGVVPTPRCSQCRGSRALRLSLRAGDDLFTSIAVRRSPRGPLSSQVGPRMRPARMSKLQAMQAPFRVQPNSSHPPQPSTLALGPWLLLACRGWLWACDPNRDHVSRSPVSWQVPAAQRIIVTGLEPEQTSKPMADGLACFAATPGTAVRSLWRQLTQIRTVTQHRRQRLAECGHWSEAQGKTCGVVNNRHVLLAATGYLDYSTYTCQHLDQAADADGCGFQSR